MRVTISGSNGFIGKHLVRTLLSKGIVPFELNRSNGFDLSNSEFLTDVPEFDLFIHLAANSFVPDSYSHPKLFYYNNFVSTLNALELCRKYNARMIILSSYVYGHPVSLPIAEDHPLDSANPYAETKIISERLARAYNRDFGVPITIFRPFNIYGPDQNSNFLLPLIIDQIKSGKVSLKDSRPKRDYIHVKDVVNAIILASESSCEGFNIYNLGGGISYSIPDVVDIIRSILGQDIPFYVEFSEERRPNEILDTIAEISKARRELNWEPSISLRTGLMEILKSEMKL